MNVDPRSGFITKANDEDKASRKGEIEHRKAAHQTRENIMRIAQNASVKVVQIVNTLIPAGLFKLKLTSEEMLIKARPAKSQIGRIVRFEFWWETCADFE